MKKSRFCGNLGCDETMQAEVAWLCRMQRRAMQIWLSRRLVVQATFMSIVEEDLAEHCVEMKT